MESGGLEDIGGALQAISFPDGKGPQLVVDDGGDVRFFIHKARLEEGGDGVKRLPQ